MKPTLRNILVIDNDDRNIFALKAVLSAKGFFCSTAIGGLEALEVLKADKTIDIALVDIMMPDMDGCELMMLIRKMPSLNRVKLVAVTAQAMPGDREKCLAAGADEYISKPVDIDILLTIIEKMKSSL